MNTPKIIVQTWKTKKLPSHLQELWEEWEILCKRDDYHHLLYTDEDLRDVIQKNFPQYIKLYDEFTNPLERVDFARYAILYLTGGIYADLDTAPLKSIDKWVEMNKIVLGSEPVEHCSLLYKTGKR